MGLFAHNLARRKEQEQAILAAQREAEGFEASVRSTLIDAELEAYAWEAARQTIVVAPVEPATAPRRRGRPRKTQEPAQNG